MSAFLLPAAAAVTGASAGSERQAETLRRGGTLRIDQRSDFDFIDPALAYFSHSWQGQYATQCKLVNLPDRAGSAGTQIVPEVATAMPMISRDGKTYTFNLKRTYRFSNGQRVTAHSFKREFERVGDPAMRSPGAFFIKDVVGLEAKRQGRARTVSGVRVLSPYRLQIRLTQPRGNLLARLTMPFFSAVPVNTPIDPDGVDAPFHSCGPYYYASWDKNRALVMLRNRFYRGPRPANPDQIVENIGISLDAQLLRCERGDSDVCVFPPAQAALLRDKYGVNRGRFFVQPQSVAWFLTFNHDQPLFRDNAPLKQAVNYAIDRAQIAAAFERVSGFGAATPTDQLLPIGFPGHGNWDLYPLGGANVARAQQLATPAVRRHGTVRLWTFNTAFGPIVAQTIRQNLQQIGLQVEITSLDRVVQQTRGGVRGAEFDMLLNGWGENYPDPYDFIDTLLSGTSIQAANNVNLSYFNEPTWTRRMVQASRLVGPARLRTYSLLERDLMRGPAPIAPLVNTNARVFVSARVRSHIFHRVYGTDLAILNLVD